MKILLEKLLLQKNYWKEFIKTIHFRVGARNKWRSNKYNKHNTRYKIPRRTMNKIMKIIASVLTIFVLLFVPNFTEDIDEPNYIYEWDKLNTSLHDTTWEMDEYARLLYQMNKEIAAIPYDFENIDQKMNWFITYKEIISKYPQEIHNTTTIYDTYSSAELDLLFRIVQCEVGDEYDFDEKTNVVSVIFNRCHKYNASITQVLTAKKQFTP